MPAGCSMPSRTLRAAGAEQVLAQAAGNPMALIELSKGDRGRPGRWPDLGRRAAPADRPATAIMAAQFDDLPGSAQAAVLLAAVADSRT